MTDALRERQEDELQVLQAVFMDDYVDLRKNDAWKVMTEDKCSWRHDHMQNKKMWHFVCYWLLNDWDCAPHPISF